MEDVVNDGEKVWYRNGDEIARQKAEKGGNSSSTWHLKNGVTQTLQVPITPNATLLNNMKSQVGNMVGPDGGKTLILEQGGAGLMSQVQKSDPFRPPTCRWRNEKCRVNPKSDCMASGRTYAITCTKCQEDSNVEDNGGSYRG